MLKTFTPFLLVILLTSCGGVDQSEERPKKSNPQKQTICTSEQNQKTKAVFALEQLSPVAMQSKFRSTLRQAVLSLDSMAASSAANELLEANQKISATLGNKDSYLFTCKPRKSSSAFVGQASMHKLTGTQKSFELLVMTCKSMGDQIAETISEGLRKIPELSLREGISVVKLRKFYAQKIIESYGL